jgi:anti-anti-sigma factor
MKLKHENYDRITVISAEGDINVDELEPLRRLVEQRLEANTRDFVMDLAEVEFLDSKALELMLWMQEQADENLGQVRLAAVTENVAKILHVTRLGNHFDRHEDVESALKSLK